METEIVTEINSENMLRAAGVIRAGGLVAFPTETVYGLGANALDPNAAKKIYAAKGRPSDNPLIIHLADVSEAERYCKAGGVYYKLAERFLPGPLTVILPKRGIIPDEVTAGLDTVAVRIPSNTTAHMLIALSGVPIAAPSANLSGKPSITSFRHLVDDMYGRADVLIDGGDCDIGLESTIIKLDGSRATLLRPGAVTAEQLSEVCGEVVIGDSILSKFDGKPLAPGMKYKHYAPDYPVYILDGSDSAVYGYLRDKSGCGILCYDEDKELLSRPNAMSLGSRHDYIMQAHRLFSCLRSFDGIEAIYARMPDKDGVGLAVFNRLIKAAGFTVIKL